MNRSPARSKSVAQIVKGLLIVLSPCVPAMADGPAKPAESARIPLDVRVKRTNVAPSPAVPQDVNLPAAPTPGPGAIPLSQPPQPEFPLDLSVALRLAEGENPQIARVRTEILAALAAQQQARALLIPTLNAGLNYHAHDGNLQRSSGRILKLSEQSLYIGGGARTLAAESVGIPAVNIVSPITEAWFEPLAAKRRLDRARFDTRATYNRVLGEVAVLYIELVGAQARVNALRMNAEQTAEIVRVTTAFARSGEGRLSDAERSDVEYRLRVAEVEAAEGEVSAASARLAERLNLDPSVKLVAQSGALMPITLVDPSQDPTVLAQFALEHRPELAARSAEIAESQVFVREEIYRPLLPTLFVGFSGGGFGGGSNLSQPLLGRFAGRTDFDVRLVWTVMNFGAGNASRIKQRRAQVGQAVADRAGTIAMIRREVTEALAISGARARQINEAQKQLQIAERGFAEDLKRSEQALGRPIEVLDNLELLSQARLRLIAAIVQFDQAQFRLFVALGSPPPIEPSTMDPTIAPPITTPLHGPIIPGFQPDDGIRFFQDMRGR